MNLSNLKHLKELSWYTTVPLFVCAWLIQDKALSGPEPIGIFALIEVVGFYFLKVVAGLVLAYVVWLFASVHVDTEGLPITLLFATFLLTLAGAGVGVHLNEPNRLPINVLWFAALGSVAFNLFQIHSGVMTAQASKKQQNIGKNDEAHNNDMNPDSQ